MASPLTAAYGLIEGGWDEVTHAFDSPMQGEYKELG